MGRRAGYRAYASECTEWAAAPAIERVRPGSFGIRSPTRSGGQSQDARSHRPTSAVNDLLNGKLSWTDEL